MSQIVPGHPSSVPMSRRGGRNDSVRSMTGYGRSRVEADGHRVAVEIRSVNHRFMDLKLRGQNLDPALEDKVAGRVRARIQRGAISLSVRIEVSGNEGIRADIPAAQRAYATLMEIADGLSLKREISLGLVCQQPGVLVASDKQADETLIETAVTAVDQALDALIAMREAEGEILKKELTLRLEQLQRLIDALQGACERQPIDAQARLRERLSRLLGRVDVAVDETRLAQEVAVLADRLDVTEELVRSRSHLEQLGKLLDDRSQGVGRKVDFLVQELGREINTVASKSQSADVANLVVEAKAELEKFREQVQNVE